MEANKFLCLQKCLYEVELGGRLHKDRLLGACRADTAPALGWADPRTRTPPHPTPPSHGDPEQRRALRLVAVAPGGAPTGFPQMRCQQLPEARQTLVGAIPAASLAGSLCNIGSHRESSEGAQGPR